MVVPFRSQKLHRPTLKGKILKLPYEYGPKLKVGHWVITPMGYGVVFSLHGVGNTLGIMLPSHSYPKYFPTSVIYQFFVLVTDESVKVIPLMPHYYSYFIGGEQFIGYLSKKGFAVPSQKLLKEQAWALAFTTTPNGLTIYGKLKQFPNLKIK